MGMYDTVKVSAKLPGDPPAFVAARGFAAFQTKGLDCELSEYEITADGRLVRLTGFMGDPLPDGPEVFADYHGDLRLYGSNLSACDGRGRYYTSDGSDYEEVAYTARFTDGRLSRLTQTLRTTRPARPSSELASKEVPRDN